MQVTMMIIVKSPALVYASSSCGIYPGIYFLGLERRRTFLWLVVLASSSLDIIQRYWPLLPLLVAPASKCASLDWIVDAPFLGCDVGICIVGYQIGSWVSACSIYIRIYFSFSSISGICLSFYFLGLECRHPVPWLAVYLVSYYREITANYQRIAYILVFWPRKCLYRRNI